MRIRPRRAAHRPTTRHRPPTGATLAAVEADAEDHDRGLAFDLDTMARRRALKLLAGAGAVGAVALAGCSVGDSDAASTSTTAGGSASGASSTTTAAGSSSTTGATAATSTTAASAASTTDVADADTVIPQETGGPYPGDGTNGPNVLTQSGIVRSDIRSSFGSSTATAAGVPLTFRFHVTDVDTDEPLTGAAVYAWHCDQEGRYSMYSNGVTDENYLRGVQVVDANGDVSFTSIFPAAYDGRWPHIHFEIYESVDEATRAGDPRRTSQLAFPKDACDAAYATSGYERSVQNLARTSLTRDMVFGDDGAAHQLATMSGSPSAGYVATLAVGV